MLRKVSCLVVGAGLLVWLLSLVCFSQTEQITITTYYPSPFGVYNELQSNKMAVGDTNGDGNLTSADLPPANGQLYTARSVIFKPQLSLPILNVREGEMVYNNSDNKVYYYNGSAWVAQGSGTVCYTVYNGNPGVCPSCPAGWTREVCLGQWGHCHYSGSDNSFACPPGGSSGCNLGGSWGFIASGQAALCCK